MVKKDLSITFTKVVHYILNFTLIFFISVPELVAGGLSINEVWFNGYPPGSTFYTNQNILMSYTAAEYSFSGINGTYEYYVFFLTKKLPIETSVGDKGKNNFNDVKTVQKRLKEIGLFSTVADGKCDKKLIEAIKVFQKEIGLKKPDGLIEAIGPTLQKLFGVEEPKVLIQLVRIYSTSEDKRPLRYKVAFTAPSQPGSYEIQYCRFAIFTNHAFGTLTVDSDGNSRIILNQREKKYAIWYINDWLYREDVINLCNINIVHKEALLSRPYTIRLRVNGKMPGVEEPRIISGVSEKPAKYLWWMEKASEVKNILFRYKLYPDDQEWTSWQDSKIAYYYFINTGQHEFRVEGKYKDKSGKEIITPLVRYSFTLEKPFISRPVIKTVVRKITKERADQIPRNLYTMSRALIIGVTDLEDQSFEQLPYVSEDLTAMENVLKRNGFNVRKLYGEVTREQIVNAIDEEFSSADENSRIIIYFSTHGFQDQVISSEGYIVCSDCERDRPTANCLSLTYLNTIIERGIAKPIKHILIIVDSCFSGLGVISKSTKYPDIAKIATKQGAYMITAGMAEQEAQMDHQLRMSTFTYCLKNGLLGSADYTEDGIITLTEILLYVQYEVATKTHAAQIPMMGRISGQGEIIFDRR